MTLRGLAVLGLSLFLGVVAFTPANADFDHRPVRAWCAGGPNRPTYAYGRSDAADRCRDHIATYSQACKQDARSGPCYAERDAVDNVDDDNCACDPNLESVGSWN
jgi:hypothetical protein